MHAGTTRTGMDKRSARAALGANRCGAREDSPRDDVTTRPQSGRGRGYPRRPPTPPYVRFRIRRFNKHAGGAARYRAATPAPACEPGLREGGVHVTRARIPPRAAPVAGERHARSRPVPAASGCAPARSAASIAATGRSVTVPYPSIPLLQRPLGFGQLEVAAQPRSTGFRVSIVRGSVRPRPARSTFTHSLRQLLHARRAMRSFGSLMPRQAVAQKLPLPRPRHRALGFIHRSLKPLLQEALIPPSPPRPPVRLPT